MPEIVEALVRGGELEPRSRVLEVGCGTGNHIAAVRERSGAVCVGVDPSAEMLGVARRQAASVRFLAGRAEELPFTEGKFDLVFSVDVAHHLDDIAAAAAESFRVLESGGRVCIVTEDEAALARRFHGAYFPETDAVERARYPRDGELAASLERAGFTELREERTAVPYVVDDSAPYRDRALSSLRLISKDAFERGLRRLEQDLAGGPLDAVRHNVLIWARKP